MLASASPLVVYAITLFTSALLLFLIQPMIGKQILPKFGGAPAVWSTCMVFYQAVLLAGYSYAHFLTKKYTPRQQIKIHLCVLLLPLLAFLIFPVGFAYKGLNPPGDQSAALWVLIILTTLIGVPFFVVSTSAPLFQRWFANTGHEAAQDPYFLYAASNLGSMVSLILYPFFIEMTMGLPAQGLIFMVGYGLLVGLAGWCGLLVLKQLPAEKEEAEAKTDKPVLQEAADAKALADAPETETETDAEEGITDKPAQVVVKSKKMRAKDRAKAATLEAITKEPTAGKDNNNGDQPPRGDKPEPEAEPVAAGPGPLQYLRWILLGFVPSSLMLGVTMYMSTDVAAVPLLWLIPLILYLLSFIIVFSPTMDRAFKAGVTAPMQLVLRDRGRAMVEGASIHSTMVLLMPVVVLLMIFQMISGQELPSLIWRFAVHLSAMFIVAMVCHGELARTRPSTEHLTSFYLAMSFGGVLGGIFNALIAPVIFNTVAEYSLVLVVACMLLPPLWEENRSQFNRVVDIFLAVALGGAGFYVLILYFARYLGIGWGEGAYEHLPSFSAFPGLQVQVLGYVLVLVFAAAFIYYVTQGKNQQLERVLDLGLPIALCLLTMLIIGMEPFAQWTAANSKLFGAIAGIVGVFRIDISDGMLRSIFTYGIPVALCYGFAERPIRLGLGVGAILLASALQPPIEDYGRYVDETVYRERSFFGVLKVEHQKVRVLDGDQIALQTQYHKLLHGTTLHGMQRMIWERDHDTFAIALLPLAAQTPWGVAMAWDRSSQVLEDPRQEALTYYHRTGPVGQVYRALFKGEDATRPAAFIGLGTGTMASYCNPGQKVTFYEIDHAVVRIAENPEHFTYLNACKERGGDYEFKMGDARLEIEKAPDKKYKLIVVDAFSSDAIPIHLTTKEAIELYLRKASDDGVVAMHISNRHLELEPVLANIAEALGVYAIEQYDNTVTNATPGKNASDWVMIAKKPENFAGLEKGLWRWPQDEDRRWKDLVHKVDAQKLSEADLADWKKQHIAARERAEVNRGREEFEVTDEFEKLVAQRVAKMENSPTAEERREIRNEEAMKLIRAKAQAAVEKEQKELDTEQAGKTRKRIQGEIDRQWERDMKWRNKVGVWTDDFSNILSIWRDLNRN